MVLPAHNRTVVVAPKTSRMATPSTGRAAGPGCNDMSNRRPRIRFDDNRHSHGDVFNFRSQRENLMLLRGVVLAVLFASTPVLAQNSPYQFSPDDYKYLSGDAIEKTLAARPGEHPYAGNTVNKHETYWVEFMKRFDHGNMIEFHEHWVDYITILSGEGHVTYGGSVTGASPAGPGELRGGTMAGGTTQSLRAGDYVQIPAGVSHIINAEPGKELKLVIFKHRI